jgi:hypothetical protein
VSDPAGTAPVNWRRLLPSLAITKIPSCTADIADPSGAQLGSMASPPEASAVAWEPSAWTTVMPAPVGSLDA